MGKRKRWVLSAAVLMLAVAVSFSLPGAGVFHVVESFYYGEGTGTPVPSVTGTFIQPWLCEGWTDRQWDEHLDMLLSAGINTVIMQWTAETPDGAYTYAGFPIPSGWKVNGSLKADPAMLEGLLKSAEKKSVKVFVGLNTADEWWNNAFTKREWCQKQAEAGNAIAKALYGLYKGKYPHAFYGWYFPWEMYGNRSGFEAEWSGMMNANLDYLSMLDTGMPLLFSPFFSSYIRLSPRKEETMWTKFFASTRLREGDIFCPQDSIGAAELTMEYADEHLAAMKRAANTKPGLVYWVNNENFTKDYKPAKLDRFISQLYVSGKYAAVHVCFSYSHYYNPGLINPSFDSAYKAFVANGQVDKTPPDIPRIAAGLSQDQSTVTLQITPADAKDCSIITVYRGSRVIDIHDVNEVTTAAFSYKKTDRPGKGSAGLAYFATVTDCWGNVSPKAKITVR